MNPNKVEKIIRLYLEGLSSREIASRVGLSSHQSVLNVISAWKTGKYEIYKEAIPLIDQVIELAKFQRDKNINIEELSNALILIALIKDLNLDYEDTILAVQHMKNIKVEERKKFLEGITAVLQDLQKKGISYKDLLARVVELQSQVNEMEGNIEKLKKEEKEYEEKIKTKKDELEKETESLEIARKEHSEKSGDIEIAKKYDELRKKLGISDEKFFSFLKTVEDNNYDISRIKKIEDLAAFAARNKLSKENLMAIVQALNEIKEHGINLVHIPTLKEKLKAENYKLDNAEARFIEYISNENGINNVQKKRIEVLKAREKSLNDEIGKLEKVMKEKERMVKELDEKIEIAENFTNFLNLHNIKEEDFLKFFSTFRDMGFEIEKIRNISNLYDKITDAGYSYDVLLDTQKKCLDDHDTLERLSKLGFKYDDILVLKQFFEFSGLDWPVFISEMLNFIAQMKTFNERKNELDMQLSEIKNKIEIEEKLYNEAIKKHGEIEEYEQLLEKIEVLKKDLDDANKTLKNLKDEISRKREEKQILDDLPDLLNKKDEMLREINDNQGKINIGLGIWELFKYSDPAEQEHLKTLAQMIIENFPYRVESLVGDLRDRAIKMLIDLTKDGVVLKHYGNGKIRIISGEDYDRNVENFKKILEIESFIRQELMRFTNNCMSEIEVGMKKGKMPEHVMALFKNAIDKFIERQYEEALKNAEIKSVSKEFGSALASILNIYLASKGMERISEDEKIFITGELDGNFSTFGIGIDEIAEAIVNDQRIVRGKYYAEWHRVLRSMLFSKMKSGSMPVKFSTMAEMKMPRFLGKINNVEKP